MRIYRRTRTAFRHRNNPIALAPAVPRLPTWVEPGCKHHWRFGSDNPNSTCAKTGKRAHPNLRGYIVDAGNFDWTKAPTVTLPNGGVGEAILLPSTGVWTAVLASGGTGYPAASACSVVVSGGTYAPGGVPPRFKVISVVGGVVTSFSTIHPGSGILTPPTVTIVGTGGSGGSITVGLCKGVRRIIVDNGGSGFTGTPQVAVTGGTSGTNLAARAVAIVVGGVVVAIYLWDTGYGYDGSAVTVTVTGGGGSGCLAHAEVGPCLVRSLVIKEPGLQTAGFAATLTGGDGTGASAGVMMSNGAYTLSTNSITIPAGGATGVNDQFGLTLPVMDDGEFTLALVAKVTNGATSQILMGTATNAGSAAGGFEVKYVAGGTGYQVLDYNLQLTATALPMPAGATNGTCVLFVFRVGGVAGEAVQPSASKVQSSKFSARAGQAAAVSALTGERKAVTRPRALGLGNCYQHSVTFRAALEIAEAIYWPRHIGDDEETAMRARQAAALAERGITPVNV